MNQAIAAPFGEGADLISTTQFDRDSVERLFSLADSLRPLGRSEYACDVLGGAVLSSLFFEPSTRTRLSFEAAFSYLGGKVLTTTGFTFSSMAKGESIHDTARVISGYCDVMVMRHPDKGSVKELADASLVPVVNAGDGAGEHPTQALLDVYTLRRELANRNKAVEGSVVAIIGDLRYGRTVHSLIDLMRLYKGVRFRLYSPASLELPAEFFERSDAHRLTVCNSVGEALKGADVVYCTRVQRERITDEQVAASIEKSVLLNRDMVLEHNSKDLIIMHPLPRDSRPGSFDLSDDVDDLPGLSIFHQTDNGLMVRMAIFCTIFGLDAKALKASYTVPKWHSAKPISRPKLHGAVRQAQDW
ncbi:MAG TPA: aspartate carbamoyltransferase [Propioniciclava tarda]|uniref:Aspartate carbamoyltransferase n=2 Tax=Propioniciclava tarda TaxID=433330 RepID=A0A4Q9KP89_PROTD|nr:aspartate carbamoyltransferase [Propioniciclava tarda]HQA31174.1 aspartate carbamoyltransferase [Propioniciclava tarda]HQD60752.1 aspartate carbamoyltransferase [Propioniciclava tarda]